MPSQDQLTNKQRRIVHSAATKLDPSIETVHSEVDASRSYVTEVLNDYCDTVDRVRDHKPSRYVPTFAHPYSVIMSEKQLEKLHLQRGDPALITFNFQNKKEEKRSVGKVRTFSEVDFSHERLARVQGGYHCADELQGVTDSDDFNWVPTLNEGEADLNDVKQLKRFEDQLSKPIFKSFKKGIKLLVGVGIIEISHGERHPQQLIGTPQFKLEKDKFVKYITGDTPDLERFSLFPREPSHPQDVYFTVYGETLNDKHRESLRQQLINQEFFKSTWNYAIPGYRSTVGPTTTDISGEVIQATDESINVVSGVTRPLVSADDGSDGCEPLNASELETAINKANLRFEQLPSSSRNGSDGVPLRRSDNQLLFLFDQITLVLTSDKDGLYWQMPAEIPRVEKIVKIITKIISQQTQKKYEIGDAEQPPPQKISADKWVIDTNALYHDHVDGQPTSILHSVLPNLFFDGCTLHVPWPVLFEMNKHPDSGSAPESANEQGMSNVSLLRRLSDLGLFSVNIHDFPTEIPGKLGNADVADAHILGQAQDRGARLLTGDESLGRIARLSNTPWTDIRDLHNLTSPTGKGVEDVISKVGTELCQKPTVVDSLRKEMELEANVPNQNSGRTSYRDPEDIIESNCNKGNWIRCYDTRKDCLHISNSAETTLVATEEAIRVLGECFGPDGDYLNLETLKEIADEIPQIGPNELPRCTFVLPMSSVGANLSTDSGPSDFCKKLLKIDQAQNATYTCESATWNLAEQTESDLVPENGADTMVGSREYQSLSLAKEKDSARLLLADEQESRWKYPKLLGVKTVCVK